MDDVPLMNVVKALDQTSDQKLYLKKWCTCLLLRKTVTTVYIVSQITTVQIVHQKVEILPILKRTLHIDYELTLTFQQLWQDLSLVDDWLYTFFCDDSSFIYDFQSVDLFTFLVSHFPDTTKTTFTNNSDEIEATFMVWVVWRVHYVTASFLALLQPPPILL